MKISEGKLRVLWEEATELPGEGDIDGLTEHILIEAFEGAGQWFVPGTEVEVDDAIHALQGIVDDIVALQDKLAQWQVELQEMER